MYTDLHRNHTLNTDSYKPSQYCQLPPNATHMSSYLESRGCESGLNWDYTTYFGLQMLLKQYLSHPVTLEDIDEGEEIWTAHGEPFNRAGWEHILNKHGGYLPLHIQAVPEGLVLPTKNVLTQVVNTDPALPWLTNYFETMLVRGVWPTTTIATQDMYIKLNILDWLEKTSDAEDIFAESLFKLHDFGGRGVSSMESAGIGGTAHLVHFLGTDTAIALLYARRFYGATMAGFSIPASEHSTITSWGGPDEEIKAFENMIDQFAGKYPLFACVSDSYNIFKAPEKWFKLKDKLINSGSTLVVRPDSGVPWEVVPTLIEQLIDFFGAEVNSKGFMVLPKYLRVIQGDGINHASIDKILHAMWSRGLAADNIAFGMGGAMLQHPNRDTLKFAMKASAIKVKGLWRDVYKDPITDQGKTSKKGRLALVYRNGAYQTIPETGLAHPDENILRSHYKNGQILRSYSLDEIRERALAGLTALRETGLSEAA